jgi:hypothetical protein
VSNSTTLSRLDHVAGDGDLDALARALAAEEAALLEADEAVLSA